MGARQGTCLRRILLLGLQGTLLATGDLDTVVESCPRGLGSGTRHPARSREHRSPRRPPRSLSPHALPPYCLPGWTLAERLVLQVTTEPMREGTVWGRRSPRRGLLSVGFRGSPTTREPVPQGQSSVAPSGSSGEGSGGWATTRVPPTAHTRQGPAPGCVGGFCGCGMAWGPAVTCPCREAQGAPVGVSPEYEGSAKAAGGQGGGRRGRRR